MSKAWEGGGAAGQVMCVYGEVTAGQVVCVWPCSECVCVCVCVCVRVCVRV